MFFYLNTRRIAFFCAAFLAGAALIPAPAAAENVLKLDVPSVYNYRNASQKLRAPSRFAKLAHVAAMIAGRRPALSVGKFKVNLRFRLLDF